MERSKIKLIIVNNDGTLSNKIFVPKNKNIIKIGKDITCNIRLKNTNALKIHCKVKADGSGKVCQILAINESRLICFA
jgi:biotin carboxyl carrier protein